MILRIYERDLTVNQQIFQNVFCFAHKLLSDAFQDGIIGSDCDGRELCSLPQILVIDLRN